MENDRGRSSPIDSSVGFGDEGFIFIDLFDPVDVLLDFVYFQSMTAGVKYYARD